MVQRAPSPESDPDAYVEYISRYGMPTAPQVALAAGLARAWFKPKFVGLENLKKNLKKRIHPKILRILDDKGFG